MLFAVRLFTLECIQADHWQQIVDLAERHHGLVRGQQIAELGVSRQMLRTAVDQALLRRVERGLYQVNGSSPSWRSTLLAHCWATGGRCFGTSAALIHGLGKAVDLSPGYAEVVVKSNSRPRSRTRLRVHRSQIWDNTRCVYVSHIPTLPLTETLLSVAMHHPFELFRAAFNQARRQRRTTLPALLDAAEPFLGAGLAFRRPLAQSIDLLVEQPDLSLSEWSDRFADWCVTRGLSRPRLEYRICDDHGKLVAQVDLCWPAVRLVVELDS